MPLTWLGKTVYRVGVWDFFFFLFQLLLAQRTWFGIYFSSQWEHSELWVASLETSCLKWSWGGNIVFFHWKREHLFSSIENKNIVRLDPGRVHPSPPPPPLTKPIFFFSIWWSQSRRGGRFSILNHMLFLPDRDTATRNHQLLVVEIVFLYCLGFSKEIRSSFIYLSVFPSLLPSPHPPFPSFKHKTM